MDTSSKKESGWFERINGACAEQHDQLFSNTGLNAKLKQQRPSAEKQTNLGQERSAKTIRKRKAIRESKDRYKIELN